jgi:multidrug efflux system membrane fusion protein
MNFCFFGTINMKSAHKLENLLIPGLFLIGTQLMGCQKSGIDLVTPPEGTKVEVALPIAREIRSQEEFNGRIEATETVEIQARVQGYLVKDQIPEGGEVKAGDVLFEIDPRPFKTVVDSTSAQLAGAEAQLKLANAELGRARVLRGSGALSPEELEIRAGNQSVATADVGKAKAALEKAKLDLEFTKILAPIDGRLSKKYVTKGNLIAPGIGNQPLTTLVSESKVYVYFEADERALLRYERRQEAEATPAKRVESRKSKGDPLPTFEFRLEEQQGFPYKGEIDFINNKVDSETGTIQIRGILDNPKLANGARRFIPGLRAKVRLSTTDGYPALLITERAILTDLRKKFVWVMDEKGYPQRREIKVGTTVGDGLVDVVEGLGPKDNVIIRGFQKVRPGQAVQASKVEMPLFKN